MPSSRIYVAGPHDLRIIDNVRYLTALSGFDSHAADVTIERVGLTNHRTAFCGNYSDS